jgi:hypothetical protein
MTGGIWTATGAGLGALLRQPVPCPQDAPGRALALVPSADQVAHARAILAAHRRAGGGIAIRPAKAAGNTFRGFDDFMPAFTAARMLAMADHGIRWWLAPGTLKARLPAAWVRWQGLAVSGKSPRDVNMPSARYWPGGVLPVGPEYAAPAVLSGEIMPRRVVPLSHRIAGPPAAPAPVPPILELEPCEWDPEAWPEAAD